MKTAELSGARLDYWVARAEGIPADQLNIQKVPRTNELICVLQHQWHVHLSYSRLAYSTNWAQGGPLLEKHRPSLINADLGGGWWVDIFGTVTGPTLLIAICRAVVRAAFGDEVEDLPLIQRIEKE